MTIRLMIFEILIDYKFQEDRNCVSVHGTVPPVLSMAAAL